MNGKETLCKGPKHAHALLSSRKAEKYLTSMYEVREPVLISRTRQGIAQSKSKTIHIPCEVCTPTKCENFVPPRKNTEKENRHHKHLKKKATTSSDFSTRSEKKIQISTEAKKVLQTFKNNYLNIKNRQYREASDDLQLIEAVIKADHSIYSDLLSAIPSFLHHPYWGKSRPFIKDLIKPENLNETLAWREKQGPHFEKILEFRSTGIDISDYDLKTELVKNDKYYNARSRVEDCVATIEETLFVRAMQQLKRGRIEPYVQEYYDVIKTDPH